MKYIFSFGTIMILALFMAGCSSSNDPAPTPPPEIVEILVEPKLSILTVGTSEHYQAYAIDVEGTISDVSDQVAWTLQNDDNTVELSSDSPGLTLAVTAGTDNIIATLDQLTNTSAVTVVNATLNTFVVTPADADLLSGTEEIYTAEGTYSDGHTQDLTEDSAWVSNDPGVVSITDDGVATAGLQGTATITASFDGKSDTGNVVVHTDIESVRVTPQLTKQFLGNMQAFVATAVFTDGSEDIITYDVLWRSDNTAVAAPTLGAGLYKAIAVGEALISAKPLGHPESEGATMIVGEIIMSHIVMTPNDVTVTVGDTINYRTSAVDTSGDEYPLNDNPDHSYQVRNPGIAYISNLPGKEGKLTGLNAGTTQVISTFEHEGIVYSTSTDVTVEP